jgi:zinc protease
MIMGDAVATEVSAAQYSQLLGSIFMVNALPTEGHTLDELENIIYEEIERLAKDGPTEAELARIRAQLKMQFIGSLEALDSRASALNRYRYLAGTPDYVAQDAARYDAVTMADLKAAAATLTQTRAGIIRVFPETKTEGGDQ